MVAAAHFVHFIQHDDGIHRLTIFQGLNQFSRHGSDVGTTMPFNFSFIAHAADRKTVKFSIQGTGNAFSDACFSYSWRPYKADDTPFDTSN